MLVFLKLSNTDYMCSRRTGRFHYILQSTGTDVGIVYSYIMANELNAFKYDIYLLWIQMQLREWKSKFALQTNY